MVVIWLPTKVIFRGHIAKLTTGNVAIHHAGEEADLMVGNRCEIEVFADEGPILVQKNGFGIIGRVPSFIDGGPQIDRLTTDNNWGELSFGENLKNTRVGFRGEAIHR